MKRQIGLFIICMGVLLAQAQTTSTIRRLEKQRSELHKQISESESLLLSTKKDVKSQLDNLALLTGQISERQKYIWQIENDVRTIQLEINRLTIELKQLEKDLADKKEKYARSLRYMYRNKSVQEKLMFIFSADNLNQMYRRMRYVREYAEYQHLQGIQLQHKQKQIGLQRKTLLASQKAKEDLLKQGEAEKLKLQNQEKERKTLLASLQKKQRSIQQELNKKRRSADKLNAQIDRLIEQEIAEARKKAADKKRNAATAKKGASEGKTEIYKTDADNRLLSGSFEKNKGILPVPITGPYVIVGHYGQYQVSGLKNVRLDNKGIDIKGKEGANARAIFDGEVSAIFQYNGLNNVLVRHGSYISVYCNLSSVRVKKGSPVRTRDILGEIYTDQEGNAVLHFQLRKETAKLNPEQWLNK